MARELTTLVTIDPRNFKFSRIKRGIFNDMLMRHDQFNSYVSCLEEIDADVAKIRTHLPLNADVIDIANVMGVTVDELVYREVEVVFLPPVHTASSPDWSYKISYLAADPDQDNSPGMRVGDKNYTRDEIQKLG